MDTVEVLKGCGLSAKEAATYLAVLELGQSTVNPIAQQAGLARTSVYNFIDDLVERGYITRVELRGRNHYSAVAPDRLLVEQQQKMQQLQKKLPHLNSLYDRSRSQIKVSYFAGAAEVRNIVREELSCAREAWYIWPGDEILEMIGGVQYMNEIDSARIQKKIAIKTIRFRRRDIPYALGAHGKKYLRTLRWAPGYFDTKMGVGLYDSGKVGFFGSRTEAFGVLIESRELYQLMCSFYALLWKDCLPAKEGEGGAA